jgi:hypothetical protein
MLFRLANRSHPDRQQPVVTKCSRVISLPRHYEAKQTDALEQFLFSTTERKVAPLSRRAEGARGPLIELLAAGIDKYANTPN